MNEWNDILKQKLSKLEADPDPSSWDAIQAGYQKARRKKRNKTILWIASAFLILSLSVVLFQTNKPEEQIIHNRDNTIDKQDQTPGKGQAEKIKPQYTDKQNPKPEKQETTAPPDKTTTLNNNRQQQKKKTEIKQKTPEKTSVSIYPKNNNPESNVLSNSMMQLFKINAQKILVLLPRKQSHFMLNEVDEDSINTFQFDSKRKTAGNFYLKIVASIAYSDYYSATPENKAGQIHEDFTLIQAKSEKWNLAFNGGINLLYRFDNSLTLQSGLFFSQYKTRGEYDFVYDKIPIRDSATNVIIDYIKTGNPIKVKQSASKEYNYFEIPLIMGIEQKISDKFSINYKFGGNYFGLINSKGNQLNPYDLTVSESSSLPLNKSAWGVSTAVGLHYKLNNDNILGTEFYYKQFVKSVYTESYLNIEKPYFIGFSTYLMLKL